MREQPTVTNAKRILTEPPMLGPQQLGYAKAFQTALMDAMREGGMKVPKDVMWSGRIQDSGTYRDMLDWLEFFFIQDTGGHVERGTSVKGGDVSHIAIFHPTVEAKLN